MGFRDNMGGMLSQMSGLFGGAIPNMDAIFEKITTMKATIEEVQTRFQDPDETTFVCVCIPEFLSVYETERLVQELYKQGMDTHNIVVNQLLNVPKEISSSMETIKSHVAASGDAESAKAVETVAVGMDILCARHRMQQKYLNQIDELYGDFNVVKMPLLGKEVRGTEALLSFSPYLVTPYESEA